MCFLCYLQPRNAPCWNSWQLLNRSLPDPCSILGPAIQVIDSSLVELGSVNVDNHDFVL